MYLVTRSSVGIKKPRWFTRVLLLLKIACHWTLPYRSGCVCFRDFSREIFEILKIRKIKPLRSHAAQVMKCLIMLCCTKYLVLRSSQYNVIVHNVIGFLNIKNSLLVKNTNYPITLSFHYGLHVASVFCGLKSLLKKYLRAVIEPLKSGRQDGAVGTEVVILLRWALLVKPLERSPSEKSRFYY